MKRYITPDDFKDVYGKARQRGLSFILSKFNFKALDRTRSAFDASVNQSSNWWSIPLVNDRWDQKITGDAHRDYEDLLVNDILKDKKKLRLISFGCGDGSHELKLASYGVFDEVIGIDIAPNLIEEANQNAKTAGLNHAAFICDDIYTMNLAPDYYDVVLFHSALHHFKNVQQLLVNFIKPCLQPDGLLVINEYVGPDRLQFPEKQLKAINNALKIIPSKYKKRFQSNRIKSKFYGSGLLRMIIADPSECVDSSSIIPAIHSNFEVVYERAYGGNILMNVLKDISHHFINPTPQAQEVLNELFLLEDKYLEGNPSDFVFGVYKNR